MQHNALPSLFLLTFLNQYDIIPYVNAIELNGEITMRYVKISNENNNWQYFETLKKNRNKRHSSGEFFVEGVRNINECLKNNWEVSAAIFAEEIGEQKLSDWAKHILKSLKGRAVFYMLKKELLDKLSDKQDKNEASEVIFIVKSRLESLKDLSIKHNSTILIFDRASNKGNLGSIIRSCDAFDVDCLILAGHCVDMYDGEVLRASTGSFFKQRIIAEPSFNNIADWIREQKNIFDGLTVFGTSEKGEQALEAGCFESKTPLIIILGNETMGMSENFRSISDCVLRIQMSGKTSASSLNAACAASIILHEAYRIRSSEEYNC